MCVSVREEVGKRDPTQREWNKNIVSTIYICADWHQMEFHLVALMHSNMAICANLCVQISFLLYLICYKCPPEIYAAGCGRYYT